MAAKFRYFILTNHQLWPLVSCLSLLFIRAFADDLPFDMALEGNFYYNSCLNFLSVLFQEPFSVISSWFPLFRFVFTSLPFMNWVRNHPSTFLNAIELAVDGDTGRLFFRISAKGDVSAFIIVFSLKSFLW